MREPHCTHYHRRLPVLFQTNPSKYHNEFLSQDCDIPEYVNCMVYASSGEAVAGDSNGSLQFWQDGKDIEKSFQP